MHGTSAGIRLSFTSGVLPMLPRMLSCHMGVGVEVEQLEVEASEAEITIDLKYRLAGREDSRRMRFQRSGG